MFEILATASAIKSLYNFFSEEVSEKDFFEFLSIHYDRLPESAKNTPHYIVNPEKLKRIYAEEASAFVVDENEKAALLRAIRYIKKVSENLPENTSFEDRLEHAKLFLPTCFYTDRKESANIVNFNDELNKLKIK